MKTIEVMVNIETVSKETVKGLFKTEEIKNGIKTDLADGTLHIELIGCEEGMGFSDSTTMNLILTYAIGISAGIVANALYDAIGIAINRLTVNGQKIRPTKEELIQALEIIQRIASYEQKK